MADIQQFHLAAVAKLVSTTTIQGVFFGIGFTLYCMCVKLLYRDFRKGGRRKKSLILFIYSSFIVLFTATSLVNITRSSVLLAIDHKGSVQDSFEFTSSEKQTLSATVMLNFIAPILLIVLTASMQIWRVWTIWTLSPYAIIATVAPLLMFLAALGLNIYVDYGYITGTLHPYSKYIALGASSIALNVVFNVLVSSLVVGRIIYARRRIAKLMGSASETSSQYTSIVAMFIESYTLVAVFYLAYAIALATSTIEHPGVLFFSATISVAEMIANLFVVYRVLLGRAWTRGTGRQMKTEIQISTLRWDSGRTSSGGGGGEIATQMVVAPDQAKMKSTVV